MAEYPQREYIVRETTYPDATKQEAIRELVRCKDCKMFYMKKDRFGKVPWCKAWHKGTIETMFCGWGKRKDGEEHG